MIKVSELTNNSRETNTFKAIGFLQQNKENAYTIREIGRALRLKPLQVSVALNYAKRQGKVKHSRPYWYYYERMKR